MKTGSIIQKICMIVGIGLLIGAVVTLAFWRWNIHSSEKKLQYYVNTLQGLIPDAQDTVPEERRDNTMPVLSVDGIDFVGLVELPRYGSVLPVCAQWGKTIQYPCRFGGSIYDGTMQLGATTQKGQYDFYREISVGDILHYTDAEGNRYTYTVTSLHSEKHADQAALQQKEAALTLFIKNIYSFEYLIAFCDVAS